ncbi:MAG: tetratricopeptide repeat protein [Bacteroidia bacterium]
MPHPCKAFLRIYFLPGILFLLPFISRASANNHYCDSLRTEISKAGSDTLKAQLCHKLVNELLYTDISQALAVANEENRYAVNSNNDQTLARSFDGLGLVYEYKFEYNTALSYYTKSLSLRQKNNEIIEIAAGLGNVGVVHLAISDYPTALKFLLQSLEVADENKTKFPDNHRLAFIRANALANIGLCYFDIGDAAKALEYNNHAVDAYTVLGDQRNVIATLNTIANILNDQKKYRDAIALQKKILKMNAGNGDDPFFKIEILNNLGTRYERVNLPDSALYYFNLQFDIPELQKDEKQLGIAYHNVGEVNYHLGNEKQGVENILRSLEYSLKTQTVELERDNYEILFDHYYKQKNYEKALETYRLFIAARDSVYNEENTRKTVQAEMNYEFGKKEAITKAEQASKDAIAEEKQQRDRLIRNAFIAGFLLVLLLAAVAFRGYRQKQRANLLLSEQKKEIAEQKAQIDDSIGYARYIQRAILPSESEIISAFKDVFGLYKPKDVVSGDFYWFAQIDRKVLIAVADCTGHGVPGAFMSLLGSDKLNQIVQEKGITTPGLILSELNKSVKKTLKQNDKNSVSRDGMDIALCQFDLEALKMQYAGANRPVYIIREGILTEYAPTKAAIGGLTEDQKQFENLSVDLKPGDQIYLFSDGYADQFGGPSAKKFMTKRLKELLLRICMLPMKEQEAILERTFSDWKGSLEQLDDILIIGIAI